MNIWAQRRVAELAKILPGCLLLVGLSISSSATKEEKAPVWMRVNTGHFTVLTDAPVEKAQETALRFEQTREVFAEVLARTRVRLPKPIEIVAFRATDEYQQAAPPAQATEPGFFLSGEDRDYIVLNLQEPESWESIEFPLFRYFLYYNYPPAEDWFDQGLATYLSSLRIVAGTKEHKRALEIGSDPGGLSALLKSEPWVPVAKLFATTAADDSTAQKPPATAFCAESWLVIHYLATHNSLGDVGSYFQLVKNEHLSADAAIEKSFGMSAPQFDQKLREYAASMPAPKALDLALDATTVGYGREEMTLAEAQSLIMEMVIRVPEHRAAAIASLNSILSQPKLDNAVVHRALGWELLRRKQFADAVKEFQQAMALRQSDTWTRMELSITKYEAARATGKFQGVPNMMLDLQVVLDWYPDFAEAYNLLGLARLEGGGTKSAIEAMHSAIALSPRNESYLLNLARIEMEAKQWDEATALLKRLGNSTDPKIAQPAKQNLADLPTLKKYGVSPQKNSNLDQQAVVWSSNTSAQEKAEDAGEPLPEETTTTTPLPDKRPVKFVKGKLVSVDCSKAPAATLTISAGGKKMQFLTQDYKLLPVIGADGFSCDWKDRTVSLNYKPGNTGFGDLVSVELE